jgi:hypothetical protein
MLTNKINGLNDPICIDDSSNDFINSRSSLGFIDWRRLDTDNNCFPILAKRSGSGKRRSFAFRFGFGIFAYVEQLAELE